MNYQCILNHEHEHHEHHEHMNTWTHEHINNHNLFLMHSIDLY